jgi:hypothetical protein
MSDAVDLLPLKQRAPAQGDLADVTGGHLPGARILLLVNYRPEYQHNWGNKTFCTQLRIDPLASGSAASLARSGPGYPLAAITARGVGDL